MKLLSFRGQGIIFSAINDSREPFQLHKLDDLCAKVSVDVILAKDYINILKDCKVLIANKEGLTVNRNVDLFYIFWDGNGIRKIFVGNNSKNDLVHEADYCLEYVGYEMTKDRSGRRQGKRGHLIDLILDLSREEKKNDS